MPQNSSAESAVVIREGTIDEAMAVDRQIPEFHMVGDAYDRATYEDRLRDRPKLILVAEVRGDFAGFKVGYEEDPQTFYSWLGGVVPEFRRTGVANALRERQEAWARSSGYERIRVKSMKRFPQMLRLLVSAGYGIVTTEGEGERSKIVFELPL